ncbi:MAG: endopeptidase La, partial [bacterium]|nr:endopeptidase La [bacterium]
MTTLLDQESKEKIVPLVPLRDGVVFPHTENLLTFGRPKSLAAIRAAFSHSRQVCFVLQKNPRLNEPSDEDLYTVGTLGELDKKMETEEGIHALVKGLIKVQIVSLEAKEPFLLAKVTPVPEKLEENDEISALTQHLTATFQKAVKYGKPFEFLTMMNIMSGLSALELSYQIASTLEIKPLEKQELLEITDLKKRLSKVSEYLDHEVKVLEIERKIAGKTQESFDKSVKEAILREKKKAIEKELGEETENRDIRELAEKVRRAGMPDDVREVAQKELKRLSQMSPLNPEASYLRTYLDWLLELPWSLQTPNNTNIKTAEKILNEDHYGLKKIKERIVEYLAVHKLAGKIKGPIMCFVGPPGVGKTSIGKSIARSLGRKFIRISLGGIRDEAEIRGHRRTYVGALPGRIIQSIKQAGSKNPVFMLDEIDKVGADFRGDPSAALLEALDPEQNNSFSDHYLEVPFDLSDVMFVTTANILDTIPPALRDRMEVIHFPGYTEDEKFNIAKEFLWKKQLEAHGLKDAQLSILDSALHQVIRRYTREAGVRSLERELASILRKVAKKVAEGKKEEAKITPRTLSEYLGPAKFTEYLAEKKDETGMSTGLAWTEAGGDILFIEVALMPGKGSLTLTGHLGEVMKESCQAAMSYVRSRAAVFGLSEKFYQKIDVHVHVPEGAVPKDGPSAGIAITTALVSALTKIPVRKDVGMTGEITLRGRILEIGGIKEKVIAAHRAGLKTIVLPKDNKKDLEDIPQNVLKDLKFIFVKHMDEALKIALKGKIKVKKEIVEERIETSLS